MAGSFHGYGRARRLSWVALGAMVVGCGDDGGRTSDNSGNSSITEAGSGTAETTPTTTATASVSVGESSGGSNSVSDSQSTPSTVSDATSVSDSATTDATSASASDPGSSTGPVSASDSDSTGTTGEPPPNCEGMGMGGFDFSYLWVANTDQGSISKVNTETLVEEARYFSDLTQSGASSPSRTSVNITGRFVVVSNRNTGWVTKVAANKADCIDKNGNGMIETSPDKDTLLPWGSDECQLWSTQVTNNVFSGGAGPRGTTWTPGDFNKETCQFDNQKVWVGWLTGPGQAVMGRLDGETGALEVTVPLPNWPLYDAPNGYAPYGAAVDAAGYVWTSAVFSDSTWRIDPVTLEVKQYSGGNGDAHYGMTTDSKGKVWFANYTGHGGVSMFDPMTEQFTIIPGSTGNLFRGIAVGADGNVWAANNGGALGCGLIQISADTLTVVTFHQFDQCGTPVGVSIDVAGKVWMVDYNGWAYKIDPETYAKELVPIANVHYTYSDMTGGGLLNAVMPQ
ncbi:lyase [Nannocystis sp.]|uniref:Vgb family protein n=1 Tax=Nannocystis sp. TaxID=1962667 RepID=UPI0025E68AA9|nr:lyase [Nannocystis sp.]MBK7829026.1 lyase [Nannocystis sp.]